MTKQMKGFKTRRVVEVAKRPWGGGERERARECEREREREREREDREEMN